MIAPGAWESSRDPALGPFVPTLQEAVLTGFRRCSSSKRLELRLRD